MATPHLQEVFLQAQQEQRKILNVYVTAGFPELHSTVPLMETIQNSGADIIELGMPYSDPLADGPVIQDSSLKALKNGMTIAVLLEQLKNMRQSIKVPVILMGYMNPVMQYGFEKFCADASSCGVNGFILPDMPMVEFEKTYRPILEKYQLDLIFLVTPETQEERVKQIDGLSSGFLYAVSSSSTTGTEQKFTAVEDYVKKLQQLVVHNPILVGFGIRDLPTFQSAAKFAAGGIIGTAFIKAVDQPSTEEACKAAETFLSPLQHRHVYS